MAPRSDWLALRSAAPNCDILRRPGVTGYLQKSHHLACHVAMPRPPGILIGTTRMSGLVIQGTSWVDQLFGRDRNVMGASGLDRFLMIGTCPVGGSAQSAGSQPRVVDGALTLRHGTVTRGYCPTRLNAVFRTESAASSQ